MSYLSPSYFDPVDDVIEISAIDYTLPKDSKGKKKA